MLKRNLILFFLVFLTILTFQPQAMAGKIISINSYDSFVRVLETALENNDSEVVVNINNYNKSTYDFNRAMKYILERNPKLQMKYSSAYQEGRQVGKKAIIRITFVYNGQNPDEKLKIIDNYQEFYSVLKNALKNFDSELYLQINNYDSSTYDFSKTINKILADDPDLDYGYSGCQMIRWGEGSKKAYKVTINYAYDKDTMLAMRQEVQKRCKAVIAYFIRPGMSAYQKELTLHDYLVSIARYSGEGGMLPKEEYTAYGVLMNGRGVCAGYAKAMQKLLRMAGIPCLYVSGTANGVPHAWNIVKLGDGYYHLDATWDDPVTNTGQDVLRHTYFNVTDAKMAKDHIWDRRNYPKCRATAYSYRGK